MAVAGATARLGWLVESRVRLSFGQVSRLGKRRHGRGNGRRTMCGGVWVITESIARWIGEWQTQYVVEIIDGFDPGNIICL
jgi:hypothetical protein